MGARLAAGNHEFLRHLDYKRVDPREALRLGSEAPYYLSVVFRDLSMPDMERRMLDVARRAGRGIWRDEAELRALQMDLEARRYAEVERRARAAGRWITDASRVTRLRRLRLEALYGLGRGRELLDLLEVHLAAGGDPEALRRSDPNLDFLRAAGASLAEDPEWEEYFRTLAWGIRASGVHARAVGFLEREPGRLRPFEGAMLDLLRAKAALGEGRREAAAALMAGALPSLVVPAGSVVIEEAGRLFLALDRPMEGLELLDAIPAVGDEWVRDEFRGRLLRAAGSRGEAALSLERSFRASTDPAQRQRALWHYLDLRIQSGEKSLGLLFWNRREYVLNGSYFADILEDAVTELVAGRGWAELEVLRDFAREKGVPSILARADFILARAITAGYLPVSPARDPDRLLEEVRTTEPAGYYALLASHLTRRPYPRLDCEPSRGEALEGTGGNGGSAPIVAALPELVDGYFRFGLPLHAYRAVQSAGASAPFATVQATARELQATGHYQESIRLAAALAVRDGACARSGLLELAYPALYVSDVERIAAEQELPVRAILALVREESAFEADAVSRVGAVGLTQLMPATAEEVARRLGMGEPDLSDPITNLRIGLRHLAGLRRSTGGLSRTVMAYNAGLSRLRSWERQFGGLPDELFAEAIPYDETRLYARQIVIAAVMYGALYDAADPEDTLTMFFPGLAAPAIASATP